MNAGKGMKRDKERGGGVWGEEGKGEGVIQCKADREEDRDTFLFLGMSASEA